MLAELFDPTIPTTWIVLGLAAQLVFFSRFLVQWVASERAGRSVVPVLFWWLSLLGAGGLLAYGVLRGDPVIILGQLTGFAIYLRNLFLIKRERKEDGAA